MIIFHRAQQCLSVGFPVLVKRFRNVLLVMWIRNESGRIRIQMSKMKRKAGYN